MRLYDAVRLFLCPHAVALSCSKAVKRSKMRFKAGLWCRVYRHHLQHKLPAKSLFDPSEAIPEPESQNRQKMKRRTGRRCRHCDHIQTAANSCRGCRQRADGITVSAPADSAGRQCRRYGPGRDQAPITTRPQKGSRGAALPLLNRPILPLFARTPLLHSPTNRQADRSSSCTPTGFLRFLRFRFFVPKSFYQFLL